MTAGASSGTVYVAWDSSLHCLLSQGWGDPAGTEVCGRDLRLGIGAKDALLQIHSLRLGREMNLETTPQDRREGARRRSA